MKILITGGCGFLGSNLANHFLNRGAKVFVLDSLFREGSQQNLRWLQQHANSGLLYFEKVDISINELVDDFFAAHSEFNYIVHLAGQVAMTTSISDPRLDMLTNIVGTFNVLEAVRRWSPDAFIAYSSTNKVYGDLEWLIYEEGMNRYSVPAYPSGFREDLPLDFASPYGCSKGAADQYVRDWHRNYGCKTVVFRHSSMYGGRQFSTYDQGWVGWFCRKAAEQQIAKKQGKLKIPFTVSGGGKQVRDLLHVEDVVALYETAYENRDRICGKIFNIGGGIQNSYSILQLIDELEALSGVELEFSLIEPRKSDQKYFVADSSTFQSLTHWYPNVIARRGIAQMFDWEMQCNNI